MRLRQIALVAQDLQKARADIVAVLGLGADYADPGVGHFGLENAVWPIGDTFLEVVSPKQAGTTAGRLLDKRGGDGGYMTIFQVDDIAAGARTRRHRTVCASCGPPTARTASRPATCTRRTPAAP